MPNELQNQTKALIAEIEKHFWKAWDGSPYLLSFGDEVKHTCISLDWDWWQQFKAQVEGKALADAE